MPDDPSDVIGRQIVTVDLRGPESAGLELQRRLPRLCADLVAPVLERTLARCGPPEGWTVIDRLEVDLGAMALDDLERDLPAAVGREVETFLRRHPMPASPRPSPPGSPMPFPPLVPLPFPPPFLPSSMPGEGPRDNVRHRTHRETADAALIFFLPTGRLPWSFRLPAGRHLEEVLLDAWSAGAGAGTARPFGTRHRAELIAALVAPAARQRLILQFSPAFRRTLLRLLSETAAGTVDNCLAVVADDDTPATDLFRARLWDVALVGLSADAPPAKRELLTAAWQAVPPGTPGRAELAALLKRRRPAAAATVPEATTTTSRTTADSRIEDDIADGVYVVNAGVVLLHPFLPRLFEGLRIADDDRLLQPERALGLLHHLATSEVTAPEYDLVLAKALCGVPIDEPSSAVTLTREETDEAAALLDAAIRHWDALGGTGHDGLRNTFLVRPGKLTDDRDGDWLLRVEAQSFDILLDRLPWGISMIRLPWMRSMLRVEWR